MLLANSLAMDVRYAVRLARTNRGLTAVMLLSLALGIGASSAVFSVVYGYMIGPWAYKDFKQMVVPTYSEPDADGRRPILNYTLADFLTLQASAKSFQSMIVTRDASEIAMGDLPEAVLTQHASANFFEFFGVPAAIGRTFTPKDVPTPQAPPPVAVIGHRFWLKHFHADPQVVGKQLLVDEQSYTVLGVMPPRFTWLDTDVYVPLTLTPDRNRTGSVTMRLRQGVRPAAASEELQALTSRLAAANPAQYPKLPLQVRAIVLRHWLLANGEGKLLILMSAALLLLIIGCGNASILLLSRATVRQKEIAMRLAFGASANRILRQLLTESVLIALLGGSLGVLFAYWGLPSFLAIMPPGSIPQEAEFGVNLPVLLCATAVSIMCGILFGLAPAHAVLKADLNPAIQDRQRAISLRNLLVVGEVTLTMLLLTGAGLAVRHLVTAYQTKLGYDPHNVLSLEVSFPRGHMQSWAERSAYFDKVRRTLAETPGVEEVASDLEATPPWIGTAMDVGVAGEVSSATRQAHVALVSADYFHLLRIPLLAGRVFNAAEVQRADGLAVINENMARRYWAKGQSPIGAHTLIPDLAGYNPGKFTQHPRNTAFQIVGICATAQNQGGLAPSEPAVYLPYTFVLPGWQTFLVRTSRAPLQMEHTLRERISKFVDAGHAVSNVQSLDNILFLAARADPRWDATLFGIFATVALLLAAGGMYSVMAFTTAQRTREFGIRMALGAQVTQVARTVLWSAAKVTLTGVFLGSLLSMALSRVLTYYEQGWQIKDPLVFSLVASLVIIVGVLASLVPARRATLIQPTEALRHE